MTESELQKEVIKELKRREYLIFRMNSGYIKSNVKLSPPGTPDLLVVTPDKTVWLEIKSKTGEMRLSQKDMFLRLTKYNQAVFVVRGMEQIKAIFG